MHILLILFFFGFFIFIFYVIKRTKGAARLLGKYFIIRTASCKEFQRGAIKGAYRLHLNCLERRERFELFLFEMAKGGGSRSGELFAGGNVHNFYIFNKKGACLYCREWHRPHNPLADKPDEDKKLVFGLLFSLKQFAQSLAPPTSQDNDVQCFSTSKFMLHSFETPSGYKFVLNTTLKVGSAANTYIPACLKHVYTEIFLKYVIKNPLYRMNTVIRCPLFESALEQYITQIFARI